MNLPRIEGPDRLKPLCFDPDRDKFITFDEILSGKEKIVPLDRLCRKDLKRLVIERQRLGPDYRVQEMSGRVMTRDGVIDAIAHDEPFGLMTLEAEISYLSEILLKIEEEMG